MMLCTVDGLADYLNGVDPDGVLMRPDVEELLIDVEVRIMAYILPNRPSCDWQKAAFRAACYAQLVWECKQGNAEMADMPGGIKSFTSNGFSATFGDKGSGDSISAASVCRAAHAELLLAGLLYRGVM